LNYSKKTIEENDLPDPYELYKNGEWTWDAWRNMMIEFCNKSEDNIGFYATDTILTSLIATTGTTLIDTQPNGTIINNISDVNVTRAMSFYETLNRDGVMYAKQLGDWVPPQTFATNCDKLLFLGMEPEWTYTAATEQIQNPTGVDNDIFDTVSDFAFVPFPRDTEADAYYQAYDTYGFLIPKGAKNISGAVDFINCFRVYDTDEEVQAQVKEDHINPTKIYYQEGKYAGSEKWQITWGETEYDMWREMCDPNVFTFVTEDAFGFNSDFWDQYAEVLTSVAFDGESWAQKSSEFAPIVEATVDEFRY
jgi:multiple sugar transport system substrate-binding protein